MSASVRAKDGEVKQEKAGLLRSGPTQQSLYFLRTHSRASFCASAIWAGVILFSTKSRNFTPFSCPLEAAIFPTYGHEHSLGEHLFLSRTSNPD